ncbi:Reverse transcriptase domain - like 10 [Theobroma cacao]|nr:Reverse transcriptase domain - like 10 [Theobroma cacao]
MPRSTLTKLPVDVSYMRTSRMVVRAFNGTTREVVGDIELPIKIGPCIFEVQFQVMDIAPSYNCLLGRPWIHMAGAIPSSLHQKVKFIAEGQLISVCAEEDILAIQPSSAPYVEATEEVPECSFRSFEFVNATYVGERKVIPTPCLSVATKMGVKQTVGKGCRAGLGLGKNLQGINRPLTPMKNEERFGLGYKPTKEDRRKLTTQKKIKRMAQLEGKEEEFGERTIPHLYETFRSAGFIHPEAPLKVNQVLRIFDELSIHMIRDEEPDGKIPVPINTCPYTRPTLPVYRSLNNEHEDNLDNDLNIDSEIISNIDELKNEEEVDDYSLPPDLSRMLEQEEKEILPHQELTEMINLENGEEKKEVKIGTSLSSDERQKLKELLREYVDVFAWSYQDMPGLNTDMVVHKLPLEPDCKPIKQKLRRMKPEMLLKIKEEVKRQFDAGFLEVAKYPEWVANIVPVPKKDGKVRMCVDYRDLNKASPKDSFPLPHIDTLVDNTAKHALFSFMDGFSSYNQIKMAPEDMEKTTFVTMWGTFCYKVMPFGLKNAGATYQRAMVALFHDMMHKEIEVYVDDMIAKSHTERDHTVNLKKLFERLRKFQLKLNPAKCTFGVTSGKLLGFIVSEKGIEVDLDKIRAIQELPPPKTQKEVRGFLGRLNYIARFISQLTCKCDPIFKLLRKRDPGEWNEECQIAFDKIKEYLTNPPVLMPPTVEKPLILYLTVNKNSMGCVLG